MIKLIFVCQKKKNYLKLTLKLLKLFDIKQDKTILSLSNVCTVF